MKRVLILLFVIVALLAISGCEGDENYSLIIIGVGVEPITVTKAQILELAQTKNVVFTSDDPCYASDKTDEDGDLIPRTLKGVYLDDILDTYADGAVSEAFPVMTLRASDSYETVLVSNIFNTEHGGSKMIIAYELDGHILNENEPSGALRAVFPDQPANSWVKMLKEIEFSFEAISYPSPSTMYFMETLPNKYRGSFEKEVSTGVEVFDYTYYGISLKSLFEDEIFNADEEDKMYITAWDYISDGTNSFYREYVNWKSYDYYEDAFLVYSYSLDSETLDLDLAPIFEGQNINKGMSVKNTLSVSVADSALVSMEIAFEKFDTNDISKIDLSDLLSSASMDNQENYRIFDNENNYIDITLEQTQSAYIEKVEGEYILTSQEQSININKITITE